MKCSNCGYIYNGADSPSNCPKCGYSFGNSNDEEKGLSTKSKVATGVGAAAGLAAGIGLVAHQNRKVEVKADENVSSQDSVSETITNENDNKSDSNDSSEMVNDNNSNVNDDSSSQTDDESETGNYFDDSDGLDTNDKPSGDKKPTGNNTLNEQITNDLENNDSNDEMNKESENNNSNDAIDDDSSNDETDNNSNEEVDSNDNNSADNTENENESNDETDNNSNEEVDSNDNNSTNNTENENESTDETDNTEDTNEEDEEDTDLPNAGGDVGGSSGGSGLGDIDFSPRQLDEAVSHFGIGVAAYAGSNTFSAAKECAGDAYKSIKEASELAGKLNPDGNRTITGNDLSSVVSNVGAVVGVNGAWGYLDSLQNKAKNLYNSYTRLNPDYEYYVYNDYIQEIENAHKAGEKSPLETSFENRGMDFESFAASITNGYTNYFEDEIDRISNSGLKGGAWRDSLLYRIGENNEIGDYDTYDEVLAGLQGMRDAACITMYTLGSPGGNNTVLLNLDSHKTSDGVSYRSYIEQNVLDGLDKRDYIGDGKPSDSEADDYKSDSQKQLEMLVLNDYTSIDYNARGDNHHLIINSIQNHIQDVIDFYAGQAGSESNPEGLVPANHSVYTLAQIGVSNEAFNTEGIYLSEDSRENPDGTIVPARSSSGNTFVDLFNQMTSGNVDTRTGRSIFEEQFYLMQGCYDGTEREMYHYREMLYGCNEETGEFREGLGEDYVLDVINSKGCTDSELRDIFGEDYEKYVTKDEKGNYIFTEGVSDDIINKAFFSINSDSGLYDEFPQFFETDENGNVTFSKGNSIDNLAFEHFKKKADESALKNSEIMYQMQVLSTLGSYFPVNSRSYTEQYNSAYQSYEEALNDYKNQMEEYEKDPSKFDSKPVEPTFEGMFPGFQSPKDRFVDVNTQNNARNMYLAVANGDVSIEDFVPDCEPYGTDIKDIWSAGSLFSTEFLSPEVKSKYNLTMGMEQILSKPAVNYTAEEIKANNIQPVTYESFTEAIIKGMEYTNSILTEYATRYDNVQEIQINLNTQAKNDTIWDYIKNAYAYSIEVNNDLSFNSIYVSPEDLERQAIRNEEYFGKQFALLEQIEAFNSANVALNKSQTNNKLVMNSLNEKWKWILPQYSDFEEYAFNISDNYEVNAGGLTKNSRNKLRDEVYNSLSDSERAKYSDEDKLAEYVDQIVAAREAMILMDFLGKDGNDFLKTSIMLGSSDEVRSYMKNFGYLGEHNGEFDEMNSLACLQYIYNKRGTESFVQTFNNTNMTGFNLHAEYVANRYLENSTQKIYDMYSEQIANSPELIELFDVMAAAENTFESIVFPAVNGLTGFVNGLGYAVLNVAEDIFDVKLHSHIPSMNDAIWGYIMAGGSGDTSMLSKGEVLVMQAATSLGNMAIPMIVGSFVPQPAGGLLSSALLGTSAFGNSFESCKREGMSDGYAYVYSALSAVTEVVMEKLLGSMPGLSKTAKATGFTGYIKSLFGEAREEMIQEFIDPILQDIALALDPQTVKSSNPFIGDYVDRGLRELFTDPGTYLKNFIENDIDLQAIATAGIVAMISSGVTSKSQLVNSVNSLLTYGNSNVIDFLNIRQQDLLNNGYSKSQVSQIMSQELSIFMSNKANFNQLINDAMSSQDVVEGYNNLMNRIEAESSTEGLSFKEKVKDFMSGQDDVRSEYTLYNYALEVVYNEIVNSTNSIDSKLSVALEFDIENLETKVKDLESKLQDLLNDKNANNEDINKLKNEIDKIKNEILPDAKIKLETLHKEISQTLSDNTELINKLRDEIEKLQDSLETSTDEEILGIRENIESLLSKIDDLQNQNNILSIKNVNVSSSQLESRIKQIERQIKKSLNSTTKEKLKSELNSVQTSLANSLVKEKSALGKDVKNIQSIIKDTGIDSSYDNLKSLLYNYISEIRKIDLKLENLKKNGIDFVNPKVEGVNEVSSDIETKKGVLKYLNASVIGIGVVGMGVSSGGTVTIGNIIKQINSKLDSLNKEKTDLQKLGNVDNQGNKNDADISKKKYDIKQQIKGHKQTKQDLLKEMCNYGLTDNSPITDLMDKLQSDIDLYYKYNGDLDFDKKLFNNLGVASNIRYDVQKQLNQNVASIDSLNKQITKETRFESIKEAFDGIIESLVKLKDKLPGLEDVKNSYGKVGSLIKSVDLSKKFNSIVTAFGSIVSSVHIDMDAINKLKDEITKFKNEILLKDAIAISENAREVVDAEFEVLSRGETSKIKNAFDSISSFISSNETISKAFNSIKKSLSSLTMKVQVDPASIDGINSDMVSLREEIIRLRNEGLLKDALAKTENENDVLDAEFEILKDITAQDIYNLALEENSIIFDNLIKLSKLFKNNSSVSQIVNSITGKITSLVNGVKIDASSLTSLKEEIIKLRNEILLKDAIALTENAREVVDAEFDIIREITEKDIYDVALNEYGVLRISESISKLIDSISDLLNNIEDISISKKLQQVVDNISINLSGFTGISELQTKLMNSLEQFKNALSEKNEANIQKAKNTLEEIKNEMVDFVKQNYNRDSLIFEDVNVDTGVSQYDKSIIESIDKLFGDISIVLDKVKIDGTSKFKMIAEMHSLKGRINNVIDSINSLSEVELEQLKKDLGGKKAELIQLISDFYSVHENVASEIGSDGITDEEQLNQLVKDVVEEHNRVNLGVKEEVARIEFDVHDISAVVSRVNSDINFAYEQIRNNNLAFLTSDQLSIDSLRKCVEYINSNFESLDFGTNVDLAVKLVLNGLNIKSPGISSNVLETFYTKLLNEYVGNFNLDNANIRIVGRGLVYLIENMNSAAKLDNMKNIINSLLINKNMPLLSYISNVSVNSNLRLFTELQFLQVRELLNVLSLNYKISLFKEAHSIYSYGVPQGLLEVYHNTGVEFFEYVKANYENTDFLRNILSFMTNSKVTDVSDSAVNRILSPIASSMGQAQSQLYSYYDDCLVEARKFNGINVRVYVTNPANRNKVYQRFNEFIKASSDSRMPALLRNCVNLASFHDAQNPSDYYWAMQYNAKRLTKTFYSAATGGFGNFMSWHLAGASIETVSHEFGHCFDTALYAMMHNGESGFLSTDVRFGEQNSFWERAMNKDISEGHPAHDRAYGGNSLSEDFADCVRLFVLDRGRLQRDFPNRYNELVKLFNQYADYALNLGKVNTQVDLKNLMMQHGINGAFIDEVFAKGYNLEQVKNAFREYFMFATDMGQSLSIRGVSSTVYSNSSVSSKVGSAINRVFSGSPDVKIAPTVDTIELSVPQQAIQAINNGDIDTAAMLANADFNVVTALVNSGNISFLESAQLSKDTFKKAIEYINNNDIKIDVGTNIDLAVKLALNNLNVDNIVLTEDNVREFNVKLLNEISVADVVNSKNAMNYARNALGSLMLNMNTESDIIEVANLFNSFINNENESFLKTLLNKNKGITSTGLIKVFGKISNYSNIKTVINYCIDIADMLSIFNRSYGFLVNNSHVAYFNNLFGYDVSNKLETAKNVLAFVYYTSFESLKTLHDANKLTTSLNETIIKVASALDKKTTFDEKSAYLKLTQFAKHAQDRIFRNGINANKSDYYIGDIKVKYFGEVSNVEMISKLRELKKIVNSLPIAFRSCVSEIAVANYESMGSYINSLNGKNGFINGTCFRQGNDIIIFKNGLNSKTFSKTVAHEIGHAFDSKYALFKDGTEDSLYTIGADGESLWQDAKNKDGNSISKYGDTALKEDFAESVAEFFKDRIKFASQYPNRARVLASMMIKYTEGKYFAEVNDMDSLVKLMNTYGIETDILQEFEDEGCDFEEIKFAVMDYMTFGETIDVGYTTFDDIMDISNSAIHSMSRKQVTSTRVVTNSDVNSDLFVELSDESMVMPTQSTNMYNQTRSAYMKGDIAKVYELGTKNFDVIVDLLNNQKYDILNYQNIPTSLLMQSLKYLNSINALDNVRGMTFNLNSSRAAREMLEMGFYNFTISKAKSGEVLAACVEFIKKSDSVEGAKLLHTFMKNGNNLVAEILRSDSIKSVKKLQILANCSNSMFTQLSNQMNLETKIKLFETLRSYSVDELINIDYSNDAQYRKAEIFYNRVLSEYGSEMIQKMRVDKAHPFKSNTVINILRMNSSAYANMTEQEIMKEITKGKSAGQYKLIDLGYGMALKGLDFKGVNVRFFTDNQTILNELAKKFEMFKLYYNTLPKTFAETLYQANFLDMNDPDDDLYSITENNNINRRFTAAAAGGWGKFYLWRTNLDFLTMSHEVAHSFDTEYYELVHGKKGFFSEKVSAWKNAKMKDGNSTVTSYGDTSLAEDFAESVAYFMKDQTEFTKNYPNRAREIRLMLRELTFVKYGLNNITDMKSLVMHMMNNGVSQGQIKSILSQRVTFNAIKNAYIDYMSFGTDIQSSLMIPNNNEFKIRPIKIKSDVTAKSVVRNNKAWFGNRVFAPRSSNPLVNQINKAIASGQSVVNVEINNAADMSVQALREISDLTKVQFFVKGIFSDINGNLKSKYNNPRYIARHTYTGSELIAINARLDQLQSRIDMRLPVSQRARQIYELIASEYGYLRPANGTRDRFSDAEYLVSQSLRGVTSNNIIGREGLICAGFASVFKELCTRCGVTADYIRGDVVVDRLTNRTGRHAWNVFIDENGNAVPVDACWRSGGGRDYFGRSDMFAEGRKADADEAFRDYGAIRQQVQRVQYGFNDPKSMLDFAVRQMDAKYGSGAGINALRRYLRTGDIYSMTSSGGARNVLAKVSMSDIDAYIRNNSYVDLSIYNGNIMNAFNSMIRRHGSEQAAFEQLQAYAREGRLSYITSLNGARDIIESIPIEAVRQFVNNRLSNPYYSEYASAEYVSEMAAPAPRLASSTPHTGFNEFVDKLNHIPHIIDFLVNNGEKIIQSPKFSKIENLINKYGAEKLAKLFNLKLLKNSMSRLKNPNDAFDFKLDLFIGELETTFYQYIFGFFTANELNSIGINISDLKTDIALNEIISLSSGSSASIFSAFTVFVQNFFEQLNSNAFINGETMTPEYIRVLNTIFKSEIISKQIKQKLLDCINSSAISLSKKKDMFNSVFSAFKLYQNFTFNTLEERIVFNLMESSDFLTRHWDDAKDSQGTVKQKIISIMVKSVENCIDNYLDITQLENLGIIPDKKLDDIIRKIDAKISSTADSKKFSYLTNLKDKIESIKGKDKTDYSSLNIAELLTLFNNNANILKDVVKSLTPYLDDTLIELGLKGIVGQIKFEDIDLKDFILKFDSQIDDSNQDLKINMDIVSIFDMNTIDYLSFRKDLSEKICKYFIEDKLSTASEYPFEYKVFNKLLSDFSSYCEEHGINYSDMMIQPSDVEKTVIKEFLIKALMMRYDLNFDNATKLYNYIADVYFSSLDKTNIDVILSDIKTKLDSKTEIDKLIDGYELLDAKMVAKIDEILNDISNIIVDDKIKLEELKDFINRIARNASNDRIIKERVINYLLKNKNYLITDQNAFSKYIISFVKEQFMFDDISKVINEINEQRIREYDPNDTKAKAIHDLKEKFKVVDFEIDDTVVFDVVKNKTSSDYFNEFISKCIKFDINISGTIRKGVSLDALISGYSGSDADLELIRFTQSAICDIICASHSELFADLKGKGIDFTENYVKHILMYDITLNGSGGHYKSPLMFPFDIVDKISYDDPVSSRIVLMDGKMGNGYIAKFNGTGYDVDKTVSKSFWPSSISINELFDLCVRTIKNNQRGILNEAQNNNIEFLLSLDYAEVKDVFNIDASLSNPKVRVLCITNSEGKVVSFYIRDFI